MLQVRTTVEKIKRGERFYLKKTGLIYIQGKRVKANLPKRFNDLDYYDCWDIKNNCIARFRPSQKCWRQ